MTKISETTDEVLMSRREQLEAMLVDSPDDTFLQYALAMELDSEGEHERSLELHASLIANDPPYVPSYFMSGQLLSRLDRIEEARQMLLQGIEEARQQGDAHAAAEMNEFLGMMGS
jgi:tetratricopeptide (TPR) repeat protein